MAQEEMEIPAVLEEGVEEEELIAAPTMTGLVELLQVQEIQEVESGQAAQAEALAVGPVELVPVEADRVPRFLQAEEEAVAQEAALQLLAVELPAVLEVEAGAGLTADQTREVREVLAAVEAVDA